MAEIDKLFDNISNEILTEDVKLQMAVLFESQVTEAIKAKEAELVEKNTADITKFKEDMVNKIDSYITHFCEEFVTNNTQVIEESVKIKTAERILKTFSAIVSDFNLQLDEKKIDNEKELTEAKAEINKLTSRLIESKKEVKLREKAAIVAEACIGLKTELQKAKLVEFAAKLPFDELFEKKLGALSGTLLTESATKKVEEKSEKIVIKEEIEDIPETKNVPEETQMSKYLEKL
jgi:hypothetical protein